MLIGVTSDMMVYPGPSLGSCVMSINMCLLVMFRMYCVLLYVIGCYKCPFLFCFALRHSTSSQQLDK